MFKNSIVCLCFPFKSHIQDGGQQQLATDSKMK